MISLTLATLSGLALAGDDHKVEVCHRGLTLEVDLHAVKAHLAHGDAVPGAWYADVDADGFGDDGTEVVACEAPTGFVAVPGDCDDTDPERNPGAPEVCDGADQDCDDDADDGLPDADGDTACDEIDVCPGADDGIDLDGNGVPDGCEGADEDGDGFTTTGGDCNDHDGAVNPDAVEVCGNGRDDDCDGTPGACAPLTGVIGPDQIPIQITSGGRAHLRPDLDGDGIDELFLGGRRLARPLDADPSLQDALLISEDPAGSWIGDVRGWGFGFDVDVDDVPDVLLVDYLNDTYNLNAGLVYFGDVEVPTGNLPYQDMVFAKLYGQTWGGSLGKASWNAGDVDGDGYPDALIAEYGGFHLVTAARLEALLQSNTEVIVPTIPCVGRDHRGAGPIDFDGDGIDDVVLVRSRTDITGNGNGVDLIVVWGDALSGLGPNPIPPGTSCDQIAANPGWGRQLYSTGGLGSVAEFGDLNGDGRDEIVLGDFDVIYAPNPNFNIADPSLWIFGLGDGARGTAPVATTRIVGPEDIAFGTFVGPAGDLTGDGIGDLVVASQPHNSYTGRVWVLPTPATPGTYQVRSASSAGYVTPILQIQAAGQPYLGFAPGHVDIDLDGVDELTFSDYTRLYFLSLDGR